MATNSRKRGWLLVSLLLTVLAVGFVLVRVLARSADIPQVLTVGNEGVPIGPRRLAAAVSLRSAQSPEEGDATLSKIGKPVAPAENAMTEQLRTQFNGLYDVRDFYDKKAIYQDAFDKLAREPGMLALAANIIVDPERYQESLGEDQAIVRTYALRFLLSRKDLEPAVLDGVMQRLVQSLDTRGEVAAGQAYDLEAIAGAVLKNTLKDTGVLTADNARALARQLVGTPKKLSRACGEALSLAFFGHALASATQENARKIAQEVLAELS